MFHAEFSVVMDCHDTGCIDYIFDNAPGEIKLSGQKDLILWMVTGQDYISAIGRKPSMMCIAEISERMEKSMSATVLMRDMNCI